MINLDELKFKIGYSIHRPKVLKYYNEFLQNNNMSLQEMQTYQNEKLRKMIHYCYQNILYYHDLFNSLGLKPEDITKVEDLYKLPILTKDDIRKDIEKFYPNNEQNIKYSIGSTGGSTGAPLKYRLSEESNSAGVALLSRGWGFAGYELGDKVAIIAGGSLVKKEQSLKKIINNFIHNFRRYSSYGMDDELLNEYVQDMIKWKPKYIRGYASSVFQLAKFIKKNNLENEFDIRAAITTAEMLFPKQREYISDVFNCDVFNTYGLNDGGISAYECEKHAGMHIDIERSLLECVDDNGHNIYNQEGKILATTLLDFSMPLLRYDTGDLGVLSDEQCTCVCQRPLLKELKGRVTDTLKLNGKIIGGPVLTVLMGKTSFLQYQFIQQGNNKLLIKLQKGMDTTEAKTDRNYIEESLISQVGLLTINFEYVEDFIYPNGEKHKFILVENDRTL